ncbi:MAG: DUF255 domain-containing protein [Saprospiraceae bacterium]|nr:DUF255 domain-containing protein [Saprospiraceae bacterium]
MGIYKMITLGLLVLFTFGNASLRSQESVQWYDIEQVESAAKKEHKKILIQVFTKWSDGFRQLERTALMQQSIVNYLNNKFLTVKLDAETRADINFRNKTYSYVTQSGVGFNELASELLQGQMAYPTFVFLDENMNLIQTIQYRSPEQFEMIITYFGDNNHKKLPWKKYEKTYVPMKR